MMMMPSIFGGNLFNDDWMDFSFPDIDKELYGKHAKNLMKTDVKEKDGNYEVAIDLPGFKKDEITAELKDGYLTISAAKGLDKDEKDKEGKYIRRERYAGNLSKPFAAEIVRYPFSSSSLISSFLNPGRSISTS